MERSRKFYLIGEAVIGLPLAIGGVALFDISLFGELFQGSTATKTVSALRIVGGGLFTYKGANHLIAAAQEWWGEDLGKDGNAEASVD